MVWVALATVYVIWGSTYLAINLAIRSLPPLLMGGFRFLAAGAILYLVSVRTGDRVGDRPGRRAWVAASIVGATLLLGGNGGVILAERSVPTGIVALMVATVPLWMAAADRIFYGNRLSRLGALGLGAGFVGIIILAAPSGVGRIDPTGIALTLFAALSWSAGSLYSRRAPLPRRPLVGTGMEMLAGGLFLSLAGIATGELGRLHLAQVRPVSVLALGYLIVFGSLAGFTAYVWLLRVAPTSLAATYAYVNPVIAVLLGFSLLGEVVTVRTAVAGAVIVLAVGIVITGQQRSGARARRVIEDSPASAAA